MTCSCRVERKPLLALLSLRGNGERLQWDKVDPHSSSQDCEGIALNILSWSRVRNGDTFDRVKSCRCLFHSWSSCLVFSSPSFSFPLFLLTCGGLLVPLLLKFDNVIIDAFMMAVEFSFPYEGNGSDWLCICCAKKNKNNFLLYFYFPVSWRLPSAFQPHLTMHAVCLAL